MTRETEIKLLFHPKTGFQNVTSLRHLDAPPHMVTKIIQICHLINLRNKRQNLKTLTCTILFLNLLIGVFIALVCYQNNVQSLPLSRQIREVGEKTNNVVRAFPFYHIEYSTSGNDTWHTRRTLKHVVFSVMQFELKKHKTFLSNTIFVGSQTNLCKFTFSRKRILGDDSEKTGTVNKNKITKSNKNKNNKIPKSRFRRKQSKTITSSQQKSSYAFTVIPEMPEELPLTTRRAVSLRVNKKSSDK